MAKKHFVVCFLFAVLLNEATSCKLSQICAGNPSNAVRGRDCDGSGAYGASRGGVSHKGIDVKCSAGAAVYAPFAAKFVRQSLPYSDGSCVNNGLLLQGRGAWSEHQLQLFYVRPTIAVGTNVEEGQQIGVHIGLHCKYRQCMTDHVHFQLKKNGVYQDPTSCF